MPSYITWDRLPQSIKDMDPDERDEYLVSKGVLLIPSGVSALPDAIKTAKHELPDTSGTDVMGFGPGLTHPENSKAMMRGGAAAASTALGGGGPVAALLSGALNAGFGPDVDTGRGVAENVANAAFGRIAPVMQMGKLGALGPKLMAAKNFALGAGQVGATQKLGSALTSDPMPMSESMGPGNMILGGASAAGLPMAAGRFLQAVQKSTPMVRAKMQPIIDRLTKSADAPSPLAPAVAPPVAAPTTAPAMDETVDPFTQRIRQLVDYVQKKNPDLYEESTPSVLAQTRQNDDFMAQARATLLARGVPEEEIERRLAAASPAPTTPPPVSASVAPPSTAAAAAETALPSASPSPLSAPNTVYDTIDERIGDLTTERMDKYKRGMQGTNIRENTDAMAVVGEMRRSGSRKFIDDMVASEDWSDVPRKIEYLDMAFPDGEPRKALQEKILEKVLGGIGSSGEPFGDLTPIERIVSFGKQKFGSKTGTDIINKIFDGSPEAYRNIRDLQKIIEVSGVNPDPTQSRLRLYLNNMRPVLGGTLGAGTAYALTAYVPLMGAAGTAASAYTGMKAITIGMDTLAEYIGKKGTKWADVLYDMATGGNRYSAQSVSNVISGLRRRAEDERDLSRDQALAEMAQYQ